MRMCLDMLNASANIASKLISSDNSSAALTSANPLGFGLGFFFFFALGLTTEANAQSTALFYGDE